MEVVEHGHVIIGVRLSHLEQLTPAILDTHAWHMHHKTQKYGLKAAEKPHQYKNASAHAGRKFSLKSKNKKSGISGSANYTSFQHGT